MPKKIKDTTSKRQMKTSPKIENKIGNEKSDEKLNKN